MPVFLRSRSHVSDDSLAALIQMHMFDPDSLRVAVGTLPEATDGAAGLSFLLIGLPPFSRSFGRAMRCVLRIVSLWMTADNRLSKPYLAGAAGVPSARHLGSP